MTNIIEGTERSMENSILTEYVRPRYTIYSGYGLKKLLTDADYFGIKFGAKLPILVLAKDRFGKTRRVTFRGGPCSLRG